MSFISPSAVMCSGWLTLGSINAYTATANFHPGGNVTTPDTDFAGIDFDLAMGEVYGLRAWKVDDYGRLRARNIDEAKPWRPGVNHAQCLAEFGPLGGILDPTNKGRKVVDVGIATSMTGTDYHITWDDGTKETTKSIEFAPNTHVVPNESCACGFYAYTDPKHEQLGTRRAANTSPFSFVPIATQQTYVLGVIRGSGRTLIGTKGFRCEKAEIVALRSPTRGGKKKDSWRLEQEKKLRAAYPDVPLLTNRAELLDFAPIEPLLPTPDTDDFWNLP